MQAISDLIAAQSLRRYRQRNRAALSVTMMSAVLKAKNRANLSFSCFLRRNVLLLYTTLSVL